MSQMNDCYSEGDVIAVVNKMIATQSGNKFTLYQEISMTNIDSSVAKAAMADARKLLVKTDTAMRTGGVSQAAAMLGGPIAGLGVLANRFFNAKGIREEYAFHSGSFRWACAVLFYFGYRESNSSWQYVFLTREEPIRFPSNLGKWWID